MDNVVYGSATNGAMMGIILLGGPLLGLVIGILFYAIVDKNVKNEKIKEVIAKTMNNPITILAIMVLSSVMVSMLLHGCIDAQEKSKQTQRIYRDK